VSDLPLAIASRITSLASHGLNAFLSNYFANNKATYSSSNYLDSTF
jgi:hypothetical protein